MATQFRLLVLVFLTLTSLTAAGADESPWYTVELIIFARPDAPLDAEHWPEEVTPLPEGSDLGPWRTYMRSNSAPFQRLPASSFKLGREWDRMSESDKVQPLLHTGWLQPGLSKRDAVAVNIKSERGEGAWVEGTIRLILARYLHLETNLIYHRLGENETVPGGPVFQLIESRRMRSREYHYLDHPLFGAVVVVTPYEPPAPESAVPTAR